MRNYHIAVHYHHYPTEIYEQTFESFAAVLSFAAVAITYPDDVLYVVILPC
jgi:hypothetical protein